MMLGCDLLLLSCHFTMNVSSFYSFPRCEIRERMNPAFDVKSLISKITFTAGHPFNDVVQHWG